MSTNIDNIASEHPEYTKRFPELSLAETLMGGTADMRLKRTLYLPPFSKESSKEYELRLASSYLNPAFSDAITKQSAKPFSRPIMVEGVDKIDTQLTGITDDIDGRGTSLTALGKKAFSSAATYSRVFLFTDSSKGDLPENASRLDEQNAGGRTSTFIIRDVDVFNWDYDSDGTLSEFRYYTTELFSEGNFSKQSRSIIYRWFKTHWEKYVSRSDDEAAEESFADLSGDSNWELVKTQNHNLGAIPVAEIVLRDDRTTNAELAETVLEHYQEQSDQKNIVHFCRTGVWLATGFGEGELDNFTVGPNTLIEGQDEDASLSVVEHSGTAVAIGRAELQILEDRMEALSLKPMVQRTSGDVTATEVSTNSVSACSDIRSWGILVQEGLTEALGWAHKWVGSEMSPDVKISIYDDYSIEGSSIDKDWLTTLWEAGGISQETLLNESIRRNMLDARKNVQNEIDESGKETKQRQEMAIETAKASKPEPSANGSNVVQDD